MSGLSIITACALVTISGNDVTIGSSNAPTQARPKPVFSAIISAFLDNLTAASIIIKAATTNCTHSINITFYTPLSKHFPISIDPGALEINGERQDLITFKADASASALKQS